MRFLIWRGEGLPTLLLHGFAGSPRLWEPVVRMMGNRLWMAAPFLPGHDPRDPRVRPRSFTAAVDELAEAALRRRKGPWQVAGYSLGGRLALGLLVRHRRHFPAGLLIGAHPGLPTPDQRTARRRADRVWIDLLRRGGRQAFLTAWEAQPLWASQKRLTAGKRKQQTEERERLSAEGLARAMEVMGLGGMPDYLPRLESVTGPVLVTAGAEDLKFRVLAARMASALPRGRMVLVPRAGHNAVLEQPRAVARLLRMLMRERKDPG